MTFSESTNNLFSALAKFQDECPQLTKDATVKVSKGGNFKYSFDYATYGNILKTIKPTLSEHELAVVQNVSEKGVQTIITHSSGQWMQSDYLPVQYVKIEDGGNVNTTEQERGSSISYMKRYQLAGMLLQDADFDDDANTADGNEPKINKKQTSPKKKQSAPKKKKETPKKEEKKADVDLSDATTPTEVLTALWDETDDANEVRDRLLKWYKSQDGDDQAEFKNEIMERLQKQPEGLQPDFEV